MGVYLMEGYTELSVITLTQKRSKMTDIMMMCVKMECKQQSKDDWT